MVLAALPIALRVALLGSAAFGAFWSTVQGTRAVQDLLSAGSQADSTDHTTRLAGYAQLDTLTRGTEAAGVFLSPWLQAALADPWPTFSRLEDLSAWYEGQRQLYQTGLIPYDAYTAVYQHYVQQYAIITSAAAAPPAAPPALTWAVFQNPLDGSLAVVSFPSPAYDALSAAGREQVGTPFLAADAPSAQVIAEQMVAGARIPAPILAPPAPAAPPAPPMAPPAPIAPTMPVQPVIVPPSVVAPPTVVAGPGVTVNVAPAPAPNVQVEVPGIGQLAGPLGLIGAGVGTLGISIVSQLSRTAGSRAHDAQLARYACQGSFLGPLGAAALGVVPQIISGATLAFPNPIRDAIEAQATSLIHSQLNPGRFTRPTNYAQAVDNATQRLLEAVKFNLFAQGIAYTMEGMTPLKQMGFSQIAGFLGELSGFQRIARGLMETVEDAAIYRPLRWEAARIYRPELPRGLEIRELYTKRAIPTELAKRYMEQGGMQPEVVDTLDEWIYNDPNVRQLALLYQLGDPDVAAEPDDVERAELTRAGLAVDQLWYPRLKLLKGGLAPRDATIFSGVVFLSSLKREQGQRFGAINGLYREGWVDDVRLQREITLARTAAPANAYRLAAHQLDREADVLKDYLTLTMDEYARGLLTDQEANDVLVALGMDRSRAALRVAMERVKVPGPAAAGPGDNTASNVSTPDLVATP